MLLESWSRAMYRGFYRFVPETTNYRDIHGDIETLRDIHFFFALKNMLLQATFFFNIPAQICGRRKIIILLCIIQKSFQIFFRLFAFLHFFRSTKLITHI